MARTLMVEPSSTPPQPLAVWMRPLPAAHRFVLHGDAAARTAAQIQWRVPFAAVACRAQVDGSRATLWMGPDEYLLLDLSPVEPSCAAAEHLEAGMQGLGHALIDVSQRQVAFEVFGPQAELILNGGCPLDLDVAEFPIGMCTRTVFAKADILLWRTGQDTFHVEVWRSFAEYLIGALNEVAAGL